MGEEVGDGVYVGAFVDLQGGEGVAEAVEGDVLGDAGLLQPFLERLLGVVSLEVLEDESSAAAPKIFFRYYYENSSTGEKSGTMLSEVTWSEAVAGGGD